MKIVFLLGVLALLALLAPVSAAEDDNREIDNMGKDILIRVVREARRQRVNKRNNKKKTKKNRKRKAEGGKTKKLRKKSRSLKKKDRKGKMKKNSPKKNKMRILKIAKNKNIDSKQRQTPNCTSFFTASKIRDYKYARNNIQKAKRINSTYYQLKKKQEKATTVFVNGTAFFKKCATPSGLEIYDELRVCNVTVQDACNTTWVDDDPARKALFDQIESCVSPTGSGPSLKIALDTGDQCLKDCDKESPVCDYKPVGIGQCDFRTFDREMAKAKTGCNDVNHEGSNGFCNKLLKDGYGTALNCPSTSVTTVAPSRNGRFRMKKNIL